MIPDEVNDVVLTDAVDIFQGSIPIVVGGQIVGGVGVSGAASAEAMKHHNARFTRNEHTAVMDYASGPPVYIFLQLFAPA